MANTYEDFNFFYQDVRNLIAEKTANQSLNTKEIMQVMQIAATLTVSRQIANIEEILNSK